MFSLIWPGKSLIPKKKVAPAVDLDVAWSLGLAETETETGAGAEVEAESVVVEAGLAAVDIDQVKTDLAAVSQPQVEKVNLEDDWLATDYEGQLLVDVYQTKHEVVIKSAMAGVLAADVEVLVEGDVVTIKGLRRSDPDLSANQSEVAYLYRECYWGSFSRSIILPVPVLADQVEAQFREGILTVRLPKKPEVKPVKINF